ncbi:hypothetical protein [Trinickia fusca]|uniref:hypothetical protein n=1 Tax=Trinickia fusca TaxID=2419777 RepID=UPI0015FF7C6E|nr:hypothetical protein [Trinickia fusca]
MKNVHHRSTMPYRLATSIVMFSSLAACGGGGGSAVADAVANHAASPAAAVSHAATGTQYGVQVCSTPNAWGSSTAHSAWVYPSNDQLAYQTLNANGDTIMDYSSAGYMGGGVAFPTPPATVTVTPLGNGQDDTSNIQAAINQVSSLPADGNGLRGVVLLAAGTFSVQNTLTISTSGVILRGSGSGIGGTTVNDTSASQNGSSPAVPSPGAVTGQTLLQVGGSGGRYAMSTTASVTDSYAPAGASTLTLTSTSGFHVGDSVLIQRPVTQAWLDFMQMSNLGPGKGWIAVGSTLNTPRRIAAITGNTITLDSPMSDSLDSTYLNPPGTKVSSYTIGGQIQQVGIEHLRLVGVPRTSYTNNNMLAMDNTSDAWVSDVVGDNFTSGLILGGKASRVTVTQVALTHENNGDDVPCTGAKFAEISVGGSQVLVDRSSSTGSAASFYYATAARVPGPNVLLNFTGTPDNVCGSSSIQPHQRWATGLLIDGATLAPDPVSSKAYSVDLSNRGTAGSGQGWSIGWGVVWNSVGSFNIQAPPGSMNWLIGSTGPVMQQTTATPGDVDSLNVPVAPKSLYLAQLCQRSGPSALSNLGY